ncbi:MAG: SAM-dependent DNA methyltransferase [Kiritimatiellae bacterium]|nr:SAM-dependent DNA methyltransferase [Kiritimatiellia bacterium]
MATEKATDFIVRDLLKVAGIDATANVSDNPEIQKALKTASKRGTGKIGRPEFLATSGEFLLVIEDKADSRYQSKFVERENGTSLLMDPSSVVAYAENGALHYATHIARQTSFKKIFAFGCSGTEQGRLTIRPIFVTPTSYKLLPRVQNFDEFAPGHIQNTFQEKVLGNKPLETVELEEIIHRAEKLHEDLRNYGHLGETEKPVIVSAILLALCEAGFSTETLIGDTVRTDGQKIFDALSVHLNRVKVEPEVKKAQVLDQFRFIQTRPTLSERHPALDKSPLRYFAEYLQSNILGAINNNSPEDVLGRFYGEFIRYSGGDGQSLGVVLTPKHITTLFADLAQVTPKDRVFDPCCGTAGFLIAAMHRMLSLATTQSEANRIRQEGLHGIEMREDMFSIATTNMILRGDGKSNLVCDDFLKKDTERFRGKGFTVGLMNPPYSQAKNKGTAHLSELRFICHLLDSLAPGGRAVVIVPQSTMVGKTSQDKLDKRYILDHHTLEGVITLNPQTFGRVGTNPVIAVFTAHEPHPADKLAKFVDFRDDGYVVFPHLGLLPTPAAPARRKRLLDCWLQGKSEPSAFVVHSPVSSEDEWLHSFFYFNDEIPSESDFDNAMADFLTFEFGMIAHGRGYLFKKIEA